MNLTDNLAPIIKKNQFDKFATDFLQKYCPEALISPIPVPIETIASTGMGLVVKYVSITEDLSELGKIFFTDGSTDIYLKETDEYRTVEVKRGTIFIDNDVQAKRNKGSERFTLAHECVHWDKHRMYHLLQSTADKSTAVVHRCPNKTFTENNARTDEEWMEWQVDGIAAAILMPREVFLKKAQEIAIKEKEQLVSKIAAYFRVSEQAAEIRLSELNSSFKNLNFMGCI